MSETIALQTALAALLFEAKALGVDIDAVCTAAKAGLYDGGKPYRWASADVVVPATEAIDQALQLAQR